jgi:1-aminocyclopropane-1-carboxylate deaminase/D-cysteine desulfhydrase-like pyridoxal-dependent ACC family enzyme
MNILEKMISKVMGRIKIQNRSEEPSQDLSPVEKHGNLWFKREDLAGGQKGRQLKFMVEDYIASSPPPHGLVSAAPLSSPQTVFAAREARAFGIPCIIVVGVNTIESALASTNVKIAKSLGCEIVVAGASQNNWKREKKFKEICELHPSYFKVPEGLGPCKEDSSWRERFFMNSAIQVKNLPRELKTLIIPTGSGNSCISILLGLATYNTDFIPEKIVLAILGTDKELKMRKKIDNHIRQGLSSNKLALQLYENSEKIGIYPTSEYGVKCNPPQEWYGIKFHPNYEAKMWKKLKEDRPDLLVEGTGIWIVGSEPKLEEFV